MKKIYLFLLLMPVYLCSCTSVSSMVSDASTYQKLNKNTRYKILSRNEEGFRMSLVYSTYQFFPDPAELVVEAKSTFVYLAQDICRQDDKQYRGLDSSGFMVSTDRDIWSGTTFVNLENWVNYLTSNSKNDNIATKQLKAKSKYGLFFKAVVIVKTNESFGSGFLISKNGLIATNYHVIENDNSPFVQLYDGSIVIGKIVDFDKKLDLALIKIQLETPFLTLGTLLDDANIGDDVIAIGTPMGLDYSVSKGIISSLRTFDNVKVIQTDCAINEGNSGGPLVSLTAGKVVGINTFGFRKNISEGLNFAVAIDELLDRFEIK